jgi:hypothetical protein
MKGLHGVADMHVREILTQRREELKASIAAVESELHDIDLALVAMGASKPESIKAPSLTNRFQIRHSMPVNDAVILAVEAGCKTPVTILDYLQSRLDIQTTLNSVRSRVSPLKQEGKIGHDGTGWVPAQNRLNL